MSRFPMTYCSQCGAEQGPGDEGVSSCGDHRVTKAERDYCEQQDRWDAIRKGEEADPRDTWGDWIGEDE